MAAVSAQAPKPPQDKDWLKLALVAGAVAIAGTGLIYVLFGGSKKKPSKDASRKTLPSNKDVKSNAKRPKPDFDSAVAEKEQGNKFFRGGQYNEAIKCYTSAIEKCSESNHKDLAVFYQNRAAAHEQLADYNSTREDCSKALKLNKHYNKALDRRGRACRQLARTEKSPANAILLLKQAMEDVTASCILDNFSKRDSIVLVDAILKELGRKEAAERYPKREPVLASSQFIEQYLKSFRKDPIEARAEPALDEYNALLKEAQDENVSLESLVGQKPLFTQAMFAYNEKRYKDIVGLCTESISREEEREMYLALLLRATFYIMKRQAVEAKQDLDKIINDRDLVLDKQILVNALIKRASVIIQRCRDPQRDKDDCLADLKMALEIDPDNEDIYHHRGQVHLLLDNSQEAMADFEKSVQLNADFEIAAAQLWYTRYRNAVTEKDEKTRADVCEYFRNAVDDFKSNCIETYALYAQVLCDASEFKKAEEVYVNALAKVDKNNANLLVHRGLLALQSGGDVERAVDFFKKALEMDEKCEFAYETLGTVEVQRGNLTEAIAYFEKAIPLTNTELEMAHLLGLKDAAEAQINVCKRLDLPKLDMQLR